MRHQQGNTPSTSDEAALLARAARGDRDAYAEFVDHTIDVAFLLVRLMGRADTAEQLLTQCYVEAWLRLDGFAAAGLSPRAWLLSQLTTTAQGR